MRLTHSRRLAGVFLVLFGAYSFWKGEISIGFNEDDDAYTYGDNNRFDVGGLLARLVCVLVVVVGTLLLIGRSDLLFRVANLL